MLNEKVLVERQYLSSRKQGFEICPAIGWVFENYGPLRNVDERADDTSISSSLSLTKGHLVMIDSLLTCVISLTCPSDGLYT